MAHLRRRGAAVSTFLRFLSSSSAAATPESLTAARRSRKLRLGMSIPSLSSLLSSPPADPTPKPKHPPNPNVPRFPEPPCALSAARLNLHNTVLSHIHSGDLDEAAALVRHHIYSNCRSSTFTATAAAEALLRAGRPKDALALHRFALQAGIPSSVATYNFLIQAHISAGRIDAALQNYRLMIGDSPISPNLTTYRILIAALVENSMLNQALDLKNEMFQHCSHFSPDPVIYNMLMDASISSADPDKAIQLFEELKGKLGCEVPQDGIVYGSLIRGYFEKEMAKEAMEWYNRVLGAGSKVRFKADSYNSVLDALRKYGNFDAALSLFDRMIKEHNPPIRINVNLQSYNIMVNGYCDARRFDEAIVVFRKMGETKCFPDTNSYNNIIKQLGLNRLATEADELFREMGEKEVSQDEDTYTLLVEACFRVNRVDDAVDHFRKMVELELRPDALSYNKLINGLVNAGKVDDAKEFYSNMVEREVQRNVESYEILVEAFCNVGRLDDALMMVHHTLMDDAVVFRTEMKELIEICLMKQGRKEELGKLMEAVEREKAEAQARAAEEKARAVALAKDEARRRKAEEAAKDEATAKASAAAIEAVLGRRGFLAREEEINDSQILGAGASSEGLQNEVIGNIVSAEETESSKSRTLDAIFGK